jgi:nucleotide-binding universal stress UspA family protein
MYRKIIVPLDGSAFAEQALPLALRIAEHAGAAIHLVHVHVPLVPLPAGVEYVYDLQADEVVRQRQHAYMDALIKRLRGACRSSITSAVIEGTVATGILEETASAAADIVFMTTHGRGPLSRFWLGSTADQLVRQMPVPLLLVPPREGAALDLGKSDVSAHILIPLDGSSLAEEILDPAIALGTALSADYLLVQVIKPMLPVAADIVGLGASGPSEKILQQLETMQKEIDRSARNYLQQVAERMRARSLRVQTCVATADLPAVAILDTARLRSMNVIALETHGRSGVARLLMGSVADKVLRGSTACVLVNRPHGK